MARGGQRNLCRSRSLNARLTDRPTDRTTDGLTGMYAQDTAEAYAGRLSSLVGKLLEGTEPQVDSMEVGRHMCVDRQTAFQPKLSTRPNPTNVTPSTTGGPHLLRARRAQRPEGAHARADVRGEAHVPHLALLLRIPPSRGRRRLRHHRVRSAPSVPLRYVLKKALLL